MHGKRLVANFFDRGVGVRQSNRRQSAVGGGADSGGAQHRIAQIRIEKCLCALAAQLQPLRIIQAETVRGAGNALTIPASRIDIEILGRIGTGDNVAFTSVVIDAIVDDEEKFVAAAVLELVFVVSAYFPAVALGSNVLTLHSVQERRGVEVGDSALDCAGRIGFVPGSIEPHVIKLA